VFDASWITDVGRTIVSAPPAYLDPGSGSFLLQLLLAGVLGGLFVLRSQWAKVKGFFRRVFSRGEKPDEPTE
jgi:hypothetical protein